MSLTERDHEIWDSLYNLDGIVIAKYCNIILSTMQDIKRFNEYFPDEHHYNISIINPNKMTALYDRILDGKYVAISLDYIAQPGTSHVKTKEYIPFLSYLYHVNKSEIVKVYSDGDVLSRFEMKNFQNDEAYWFQQSTVLNEVDYFTCQYMNTMESLDCSTCTMYYHPVLVFVRNNYDAMQVLWKEFYGD